MISIYLVSVDSTYYLKKYGNEKLRLLILQVTYLIGDRMMFNGLDSSVDWVTKSSTFEA